MRVLRVGGVHEPFNLPWLRAFEANAFASLDVEVTFSTYAGGTGALVDALEDQRVDLATLLTEGAVTAIGRGRNIGLHSAFVTSPLRWGIHLAGKAEQKRISEMKGKKFAISRFGSGSELMAYELASQQGWKLRDSQFVEVGGLDGAAEALPGRKAHIFLWERFVTAPLVKQNVFKRIGEIPSPWPSFYTAANKGFLKTDGALVDEVVNIVLGYAEQLAEDEDGTIAEIMDRYGFTKRDARTWFNGLTWPAAPMMDHDVLRAVIDRMVELERIESPIDVNHL